MSACFCTPSHLPAKRLSICGQDGGVGTGDPGGIGGYEDVEEGDSYKKEESVQTSLRGKKSTKDGVGTV